MPVNQFDADDPKLFDVATHAPGPSGSLPFTEAMLRERPSGNLFGWSQNAGMGWAPSLLNGREFLILSTHGGIRAADGTPIALGYHTGHWEVGLLMEAAAGEAEERLTSEVEKAATLVRATFPWSDVGAMLSAARSAHARERVRHCRRGRSG